MNLSQQDFITRFSRMDDHQLAERLETGELTETATAALKIVMCERGMLESDFDARLKQAKRNVFRKPSARRQCEYCQGYIPPYATIEDAGQKFCSPECLQTARLMEVSVDVDEADIVSRAMAIRNGACPLCHRRDSPVEIRKHYWIWSAVVITKWGTSTLSCCRTCGNRKNYKSIGSSLLLGWWCPPGIVRTPIQLGANVVELCRRDRGTPSHDLVQVARLQLAAALVAARRPIE